MQLQIKTTQNLDNFAVQKLQADESRKSEATAKSLEAWIESYLQLAVIALRSEAVSQKIALHLQLFQAFFMDAYGHDRLSTCLRRDVRAWQKALQTQGLAHSTINNHLASLSAFSTWVQVHSLDVFPAGDSAKGIGELGLPPLEPRAHAPAQIPHLEESALEPSRSASTR